LICTRGSCTPDCDEKIDSVQSIERSDRHSEKPDEFRAIIDKLYRQGRHLELFARQNALGWDAWGLEAPEPA
jgi:N6-adenosine-specific RNA methylase IME4